MNELRDHLREESERIKKEVRERTLGYLLAGFGVVAGIAWNDAIRFLIDTLFPVTRNTILVKFIYAGLMTVVIVLVSVYLTRIFRKSEEGKQEKQ